MDPRQYNIQGWSDFVQYYPYLSGENSHHPTSLPNFPIANEEPEPPIDSIPESQFPQFSSQIGLDSIPLDEEGCNIGQKKSRARFSPEEDKLLIQSWLNVSKDAVVGVDQRADCFWLRIKDGYNTYRGQLQQRESGQLKSRWHRLNHVVQKFVGSYKQAISRRKSGCSESDVMADAYAIFSQDEGEKFKFEHAWRLLKDEPKWTSDSMNSCSKRTKISASVAYSSSSNPDTPSSVGYDPASPPVRPMGQKAAKRKGKAKVAETTSKDMDYSAINDKISEKLALMTDLTRIQEEQAKATNEATKAKNEATKAKNEKNRLKEKELQLKEQELKMQQLQILFTDTSEMSELQLQDHLLLCNMIRERYGLH